MRKAGGFHQRNTGHLEVSTVELQMLLPHPLIPTEVDMNEPILPDDYPVYADYLYVADGKVVRSDWHEVTVARLKRELGAEEIRRCDMAARDPV
jgi:hypothetical protein